MPKASKVTASDSMILDGYEGHFENFEGGYTVGFETYTADADLTPMFVGLSDDRCQCAHWGYVVKGKLTFKTADGDETFETGDVRTTSAPDTHRSSSPGPRSSSSARPRSSKRHSQSSRRTWRPPVENRDEQRAPTDAYIGHAASLYLRATTDHL
jgi:hypothetical protein